MNTFIENYESLLHYIAEVVAATLELVGIIIILIGSIKALILLIKKMLSNRKTNIIIDLGKSLALALEFKMGAEIINTVIVRDLGELAILAVVILIRALLAFIIHWEIRTEKNEEKLEKLGAQSEQANHK